MKTKLSLFIAVGKNYIKLLQKVYPRTMIWVPLSVLAVSMFFIGRVSSMAPELIQNRLSAMKFEILQQQDVLNQLSLEQEINIDALAARLAEVKAASTRLDALGERLVQLGQLDPEEFDFDQAPPVGGPERIISNGHSGIFDVSQSINHLSQVLSSQYSRLDALQLLLLDRNLEEERTPAGWPVSSGWISSGFGERNDPFTGKRAQHEGLDFAGVRGSEILSVASGVVIWSGSRQGYGKLLEIDHGNGYITRYAHNEAVMVETGERVSAGQVVARMGETGRASAPHVHFEVLYRGEAVNPNRFVKQMR